MRQKETKRLCAYFSREGANYVNGKIVRLVKGNTQTAAETIAALLRCDTFRIQAVTAYPDGYEQAANAAKEELRQNARPALTGTVQGMLSYPVILLGFPNWWGTMPMPVYSFLMQYDFSGKILLPFCTHEGSGMGRSEAELTRLCPKADVREGLMIRGANVGHAKADIEKWLQKNGLL